MNVFLKPAPRGDGVALVRDPVSFLPLAPEGEWKPLTPFWSRRLRDGDVIQHTDASSSSVRDASDKQIDASSSDGSDKSTDASASVSLINPRARRR